MTKKKRLSGNLFLTIGLLLIAAAFLLTGYNVYDSSRAGREADAALDLLKGQLEGAQGLVGSDGRPMYEKYPDMEMPQVEIDGEYYIGFISLPTIDVELPVRGNFSYNGLKSAPCRYSGSVYLDNMIICAHNYSRHFGKLVELNIGDPVSFTDGDGNVFSYVVGEIAQVDGTDVEGMIDNNRDMTLFTCTLSGTYRVAVRLDRVS